MMQLFNSQTTTCYVKQQGQQIFSLSPSTSGSDFAGDPVMKGWQYVGDYDAEDRSYGSADM